MPNGNRLAENAFLDWSHPRRASLLLSLLLLGAPLANGQVIGNHRAVYDANGLLQPWTSWSDALGREVNWYLKCPVEQGYPRFVSLTFMDGVASCGEQDEDHHPWGGIASTYGAVLAMYAKATGSSEYKGLAHQTLTWALYSVAEDGCPCDGVWKGAGRSGWQEDAHTDKLHNYVDALAAFPEWGK